MAENPVPDYDSEPVCKRLKTDLELTFSSHLELTNQLGVFEDCTPVLNSTPESQNFTTDPSDPSVSNGESVKDRPFISSTNENELATTTDTNEEVPIPIIGPPNSDSDELVAEATLSMEEPETETPKPANNVPEESNTEQPENETKIIEPTQFATDDKTESQESGSDDVEVVQAKVKTKKTKTANQRKEIRKILSADQLEEDTLKAQREEAERRQRQRLLQRQQNMSRVGPSWQFSVEDVMKRMAHKGITMTLASDSMISPDINSNAEVDINKPDVSKGTEQEVFTLSSDDEDGDFTPKESEKYNFGGPTPFPQDFYSGGVMNNCGGVVSGLLIDGIKNVGSEIPIVGNQSTDKGAESDSSDDCIVISPPPINDDEEDIIEKYDDENNVPDELGRVLVNVGHPKEDPDIFLSTHIGKAVKPHQIGGIRFLYDNVVESMERFNSTGGLGCILAHSMGLGKTIQAAAFCDVFLRHTSANTVLVIVPINTVQNWLNEFNQWLDLNVAKPQTQRVETMTSSPTRKYVRRKTKLKIEKNQDDQESNDSKLKKEAILSNELKMKTDDLDDLKCSESLSVPTPPTANSEEQSLSISNPSSLPPQSVSESPEASVLSVPEPVESMESNPVTLAEGVGVVPFEGRSFGVYVLNETVKTLAAREKIISEWSQNRGVLLIGYEMYRMLSLKKLKKTAKKEKGRLDSPEEENARLLKANQEENMLTKIYSCLVRPGPDLVICDEGHRIKNSGASISQALKAIKTRRRVVLTGYPLQNNLMEYWCMVDFIRPSYLGNKAEFSNMFERPITNGQCADSTAGDKRLMQYRSHVLHSLLEGFVQRRSHVVLQKALPAKQEWVFLLKMTPIQYELYKEFISYLRLLADMGNSTPNPIKAFAVCCKIWNHPDVLYNVVKKKQSILDDFEGLTEEVEGNKVRKNGVKKANKIPAEAPDMNDNSYYTRAPQAEDLDPNSFPIYTNYGYNSVPGPSATVRDGRTADSLLSLEWAASAFKNYVPGHLENGTKFELLFIIIEECLKVNDRLLVFSQSLLTLDLMETFLSLKFSWVKGRNYFRLDGSTGGLERERLIKDFNTPSSTAHVFLVSTRAGSLGINLIGANRVVVFDASWNPCHDCQAVCRVYRYGQKKECQIYRFVTDCTLEKRIYDRQINKRGMANRVVDEMNPDSHFNSKDMSSTLHLEMDELDRVQETTFEQDPMNFEDVIMQNVLSRAGDKITKEPFEHESLLIDRKEKKLSPSERRMAHRNYEFEKKAATNTVPGPTPTTVVNRQPYPSYFPGYQGQGMHLTKHGHSGINGMTYDESGNNYMYGASGQSGGYYDKPIASVRPIRQQMDFDYDRDGTPMPSNPRDREVLPLPVDELRRKGVSVQGIILRRDSFLADPEGGPDIFLREGDKVYLLRSYKGSYLRLSNGRIIALRRRARTNLLDHIPPTQDLTKEQILLVINSIFKPRTSSSSNYGHEPDYRPSHSTHRNYRRKVEQPVFPGDVNQFPYHHSMSVPLPPTHPYEDFLNHQQNLQITNQRSSSGGDVTIWKQDAQSGQLKVRKPQEDDLVPDIEVIKLNPTETTTQKDYSKLQPVNSSHSQHLPKNVPFIRNPFSRPPASTPLANHLYHSAPVPESRKNPAVVSALLSGGHWQRQVQKSSRGHSSSSTNPANFTTQGIPITRKSPVSLPSELTIQPVPGRPDLTLTSSNDSHSSPSRNFNASWISPGSSLTSSKTQFQNFDFSPQSNITEQFYPLEDSGNGNGSDFLEGGTELLSELINPTQSYNFNRSLAQAQLTQQFTKHDVFPNVLNSFHGRIPSATGAVIDSERFYTGHKQMGENGLSVVGSGDDNVFHEDSYENGSGSATANLSHFGQYFCRNPPGISTAESSQSFTPHS